MFGPPGVAVCVCMCVCGLKDETAHPGVGPDLHLINAEVRSYSASRVNLLF